MRTEVDEGGLEMRSSTFLEGTIKDILVDHPEVEAVLDDYGIGCGPCSIGTCKLKDIVGIHGLSPEDEEHLMARIAKILFPDELITIPKIERRARTKDEIRYSPPMKVLVDEHVLIKRMVALVPKVIETLDLETEEGRKLVMDSIEFIRGYADRFHHAKEEEILFSFFDQDLDILKVMHTDHETGRAHVKAIAESVERKDRDGVIEHLNGYKELLIEHIRKEDEILYPWLDGNLTMNEVGRMFQQFNDVEEEFGDAPQRYQKFIESLESRFN